MNRKQYSATLKAVHMFRKKAIEGNLFKENTSFALVADSGVWLCPHGNCFSGLGPHYRKEGRGVGNGFLQDMPKESYALIVGLNLECTHADRDKVGITDEESVRYLDWLANRSPWSSAFISKAAETWYKSRVVILDTTVAGNVMGGAGVAVRRLWEMCNILRLWLELTARGVPETLAYYLATSASCAYQTAIRWNGMEAGHHNLNVDSMGAEQVVNFIQGKVVTPNKPFSEGGAYDKYSNMFGYSNAVRLNTWVQEEFPKEALVAAPKQEEVVVKANPFAKAKAAVQQPWGGYPGVPWHTALDNMGVWWPEIYKKLGLQ